MAAPALTAISQVTSAFGRFTGMLTAATASIRGFVDAFNPQAGLRLDVAMRSLAATIGYALEPIIHGAADAVNSFAGAIVGAMDSLRPAVEQLVGLFQSTLRPVMHLVRASFDALVLVLRILGPLFEFWATNTEILVASVVVLWAIFEDLREVLVRLMFGPLAMMGDLSKLLNEGFVGLVEATLQATAALLALVPGGDAIMRRILERLGGMPEKGRAAAPMGYTIGGLEDVYRKRLVASAQAMGGGSVEQQQLGVMERIEKVVQKMLEGMGGAAAPARESAEDRIRRRNEAAVDAGGEGGEWGPQ